MSAELDIIRRILSERPMGEPRDMAGLFEVGSVRTVIDQLVADGAEIEFETPGGGFLGDMAGPWRGPEGLRTAWREWTSIWTSWLFAPTELIDAGAGKILLLGRSYGRMQGSDTEIETPGAAVYTVQGGQVVRIQHFLDQDDARRAAGLE